MRFQKQNLGWIDLVPAVQKGWKRFFVLREDVARSKQAAFYEGILMKINTFDWSHRKDFKVRRRRYGRKIYVVKEQKLLQPDPGNFAKLKFSDREKELFHIECKYVHWGRVSAPEYYFVFNEPWRFVLRIRPNMIDKQRAIDPVLETQLQNIWGYLERNNYRIRQMKLLYGQLRRHYRPTEEKYDELNPLKNKPLHNILDGLREEWYESDAYDDMNGQQMNKL